MKKESQFQSRLIGRLRSMFPDCIILKNDPTYLQGIPDLTVLWQDKWALLECKRESEAHRQPNQQYYVEKGRKWSYAAFVSPENEEDVLNDLQHTFRA